MKTLAATAALAVALVGTPLTVLYFGGGGANTDKGRASSPDRDGVVLAPSRDGRIVLAGLLRDASQISLPSLKFLVDASCQGGMDAHVFAASNANDLLRMHDEMRVKLYGADADCRGTLFAEQEPEEAGSARVTNRVDRIASLRDAQRLRVANILEDAKDLYEEDGEEEEAVIVVADLDVSFFPTFDNILSNGLDVARQSRHARTRLDVLCSAGVDVSGGYYDVFATVLIPNTFVYPVGARMDLAPHPEEDQSLIVGNAEGFSNTDLLHWFDQMSANQQGGGPVPVRSCFGGLALYRASRWLDFSCSYSVSGDEDLVRYTNMYDERACEHVVLHECLRRVDPLTSVAVHPGLRPVWHGENEAAIAAENNLADLTSGRRDEWERMDRKLRDLQAMPSNMTNATNSTNSTDGICTTINNGTELCCWDNTTEILVAEQAVFKGKSNFTGHRVYNLCPDTYSIGFYDDDTGTHVSGMAPIVVMNNNVTFQCGSKFVNGSRVSSGGDCALNGGAVHFHIDGKGGGIGDNVVVRGIHSVNTSGVNVFGEAECWDGAKCGSTVKFDKMTFKDNNGGGIASIVGQDGRSGTTATPVLNVTFYECAFEDNQMPPSETGDSMLVASGTHTAVSFVGSSFTNNKVEPDSSSSYTASLIASGGSLNLSKNCFVNNVVGTSITVSLGTYSKVDNGYYGNEYTGEEPCVDGILTEKDEGEGVVSVCVTSSGGPPDLDNQRCAAKHNPEGNPCGPSQCSGSDWYCCNRSCGICLPPDFFCTQQICEPGDFVN